MSNVIDNRVLEMRFDNKQFEQGVSTSMTSLDKLKQKLNLPEACKGLEKIGHAAKELTFNGVIHGLDTVQAKFSAMQVVGITALTNITNQAINTGRRIANALTIEPIKTGFQEYETQINSIQTILSNTQKEGTNVNVVNRALDELNKYADKTIYNFTEMTRNIGTFTAAGVKLDTSVNAIQGIANLAAMSGSNSMQASSAMYQLSQALASGTVKLMDWNSVVNAGMGGQLFQDALKETSELLGTGAKAAIESTGSFRDSLQKGWITAEVLTETLKKFTTTGANEYVAKYTGLSTEAVKAALESAEAQYGEAEAIDKASEALANKSGKSKEEIKNALSFAKSAEDAATKVKTFTQLIDTVKEAVQSGWSQSWRILVGDFEQSKELFSSISDTISDMIGKSADARNAVLKESMTSGWDKFKEKINSAGVETEVFESKIKEVAKSHNIDINKIIQEHGSLEKAFQKGALTTDILKEAINGLNKSVADLSSIQRTLQKGTIGDDVKEAQKALQSLGHDLGKAGVDGIFGSATESAIKAFQEANKLEVTGIVDEKTLAALQSATEKTIELGDSINDLIDGVTELGGRTALIESFKNIFEAICAIIKPVREAFREIFPPVTAEQLSNLINKFHAFTEKLIISSETAAQIKNIFLGFFSVIGMGVDGLKTLGKSAIDIISNLGGFENKVLDVAESIATFFVSLRKSAEESDVFGKTVTKITDFINEAINSFKKLDTPKLDGLVNLFKSIGNTLKTLLDNVFKELADVVQNGSLEKTLSLLNQGLLSGILLKVRGIFSDMKKYLGNRMGIAQGLEKVVENISEIFGTIGDALQTWQQNLKVSMISKLAYAIGILAAAVFVLSSIDEAKLKSSLSAITMLFIELSASMKILAAGTITGTIGKLGMMMGMAIAITMLVGALKIVASMNTGEIARGLLGVAGLAAILIATIKLMSTNSAIFMKGTIGLAMFANAIIILAAACKSLSKLNWGELARGLTGVGSLMLMVTVFARIVKTRANLIIVGAGLIVLAYALNKIADVCGIFSKMSWEEIGKGLASVATLLMSFAVFSKLASGATRLIGVGIALNVIVFALEQMMPVFKMMAELSIEQLAKGIVAIGALLLELSLFSKIAGGASNMIAIGGALSVVAIALNEVIPIFESLSKLSWGGIGKSVAGIAGALGAIVIAFNMMPKSPFGTLLAAGSMYGILETFDLITKAFSSLSKLSWAGIGKGLAGIAGSIAILVAAMRLMGDEEAGDLLMASIAVLMLGKSIALIGGLGIVGIVSSLLAFAGVFTILGVSTKLLTPLIPAMFKLAGALATFAGTFALLGAGIAILGSGFIIFMTGLLSAFLGFKALSWNTIAKGLVSVAVSLTMLGIASKILAPLTGSLMSLGMSLITFGLSCASIGVGIALIAHSLSVLAAIGEDGAKTATNSLGTIFKGILSMVPDIIKTIGASIGEILHIFIDNMPLIGETLKSAVKMIVDVIVECAPDIAEGFLKLVSEMISMLSQYTPTIVNGLIDFLIGALNILATRLPELAGPVQNVVVGLIDLISDTVSKIDSESILNVGKMIGGIAILMRVLSGLGHLTLGALQGVLAVGAVIAALTFVLGALGTIAQIPGLMWFVDEGGSLLEAVGRALGRAIGGIIGGIGEGISNSLPAIGDNIVQFMEKIAAAGETASSIGAGSFDGVVNFAKAMLGVSISSLIDQFLDFAFGSSSMETFGKNAKAFVEAMVDVSSSLEGVTINETAITTIANCGSMLSELQNSLSKEGGLWQGIVGSQQIGKFGESAKKYAEAMVGIGEAMGSSFSIDLDAVQNMVDAGTKLNGLQQVLDPEGGLWQSIVGTSDIGSFGEKIKAFGEAMAGFSTAIGPGIDATAVSSVRLVASSMTKLMTMLSSEDWGTGVTNLSDTALYVGQFGEAMSKFGDDLSTLKIENVDNSITAVNRIKELVTSLEDVTFENLSAFTGAGLSDGAIVNIGQAIKGFGESIADIDVDSISKSVNVANRIRLLVTLLKDFDSSSIENFKIEPLGKAISSFSASTVNINVAAITQAITVANKIKGFINGLKGFSSDGIGKFETAIGNLSKVNMNSIVDTFNGSTDKMTSSGSTLISSLASGIKSKQSTVTTATKTIMTSMTELISSNKNKFKLLGTTLISSFVSGFKSKSQEAAAVVRMTISSAINAATFYHGSFYSAGSYVASGFVSGIRNNIYAAARAAADMAAAAKREAEAALGIASPSRVFMLIGKYVPEGFVIGIQSMGRAVSSAVTNMTDNAVNGAGSAISRMNDIFHGDMISQPTIRPVVDLSNVRSGASAINGMLNNNRTLDIMSNLRSIGTSMNNGQNGTLTDVIDSLDKLRKDLSNVGNTTYSINGITYDDGSNISEAVQSIVRAARIERRI